MKKNFLLLSFFTSILFAQANPDIETLNQVSDAEIYGPEQALADINSGTLVYMGRAIFPGSDQNSTCAFKNAKAYVLYNNCMSSRREPPAMDIEVITYTGNAFKFYVENSSSSTKPISTMTRDEYDGTWSINLLFSTLPEGLTFQELKALKGRISSANGGCFVGKSNAATDRETKGICFGAHASKLPLWKPVSEKFWQEPTPEFYSTYKKMRKLVETVKF